MKLHVYFGVAIALLAAPAPLQAQQIRGSLVIIGSNLRVDEIKVWQRIAELAGGERGEIAIFPTASETPTAESRRVETSLRRYGLA